ncbi:MAG: hypothetical protein IPF54_13200 [Draconibacterium sp.]|nr:hypothetical protein [Draconibacterium sp.]
MESGGVYSIVMDDNKSVSAIFSAVTLYLDGEVSSNTIASGSSISLPHST